MPIHSHAVGSLLMAVTIHLPLCLLAWKLKFLTRGGMIAGLAIGLLIFLSFGWPGYTILLLYAVIAHGTTKHSIGVLQKKDKAVEEKKLSAKGFNHVFVRGLPALAAGLVVLLSAEQEQETRLLGLVAYLAALATTLGDVASTELGQAYGKRTYRLITLERVKSGTRGGVSVEGSVLGGLAILLFSVAALALFAYSSVSFHYVDLGAKEVIVITLAAVIANHVESTMGGIFTQFQRKPSKLLLGFLGGSLGALLAVFFTNLPEG